MIICCIGITARVYLAVQLNVLLLLETNGS